MCIDIRPWTPQREFTISHVGGFFDFGMGCYQYGYTRTSSHEFLGKTYGTTFCAVFRIVFDILMIPSMGIFVASSLSKRSGCISPPARGRWGRLLYLMLTLGYHQSRSFSISNLNQCYTSLNNLYKWRIWVLDLKLFRTIEWSLPHSIPIGRM